jgi:hypothetical protein
MGMLERFQTVFTNPTEEEELAREPLLKFSFYLSSRVIQLLGLGEEIKAKLDAGLSPDQFDGRRVGNAGVLAWLWVLGAYELVRAMCQPRNAFSARILDRLLALKRKLEVVRMPDAKMEPKGRNHPANSFRAPPFWDLENKDVILGDFENGSGRFRLLLDEFDDVMSAITLDDVLLHHHDTYTRQVELGTASDGGPLRGRRR